MKSSCLVKNPGESSTKRENIKNNSRAGERFYVPTEKLTPVLKAKVK